MTVTPWLQYPMRRRVNLFGCCDLYLMSTNCLCKHARDRARARRAPTQNITSHLPYPSPPQPLTVERRRGRPAGFIRVDTSTRREPSAFE